MKRTTIWVGILLLMAMLLTSCAFYGGGYGSDGDYGYYGGYGYYGAPYGYGSYGYPYAFGYYGYYPRGHHGYPDRHYYRR